MQSLLLAFYGDDFTGSTDAMDMLTRRGYRTLLFLEPPDPKLVAERFADVDCIGIAGISRSLKTDELEKELAPIFNRLPMYHPAVIHYKVCSTFDSSPQIGSIGRVLEIGKQCFPNPKAIPILAGAPALSRYTVFGHHFASVGGNVHRLDRHPVMSVHPSTPMNEADLRIHLAKQTTMTLDLMSVLDLAGEEGDVRKRYVSKCDAGAEAILFDSLSDQDSIITGKVFWGLAQSGSPLFVVGSSGVEYALSGVWESLGIAGRLDRKLSVDHAIERNPSPVLAVSGSASPVTRKQIEKAEAHGFTALDLPMEALLAQDSSLSAMQEVLSSAEELLGEGQDLILYTARGPDDPAIPRLRNQLGQMGIAPHRSGELIGRLLGKILKKLVHRKLTTRCIIAGGDTSGFATKELGVWALESIHPVGLGAPLNRCYSDDRIIDGLQLALKGGQLGQEDYFVRVKQVKIW